MSEMQGTTPDTPLAFLMLWSPSAYPWEEDGLDELVADLEQGIVPRTSWSVTTFPRRIQPGDRIFMRRVKEGPLGMVGEGVVASDVFWAPTYKKDSTGDLPYVEIDWVALTPEEPLRVEDAPGAEGIMTHRWPRIIYDADQLAALDTAWTSHLARSGVSLASNLPPLTRQALRTERTYQGRFRREVFAAFGAECLVCGLEEQSILDAAHIVPHAAGGLPIAENGRPLCANHHRAFDRQLLEWDWETDRFEWVDEDRSF